MRLRLIPIKKVEVRVILTETSIYKALKERGVGVVKGLRRVPMIWSPENE